MQRAHSCDFLCRSEIPHSCFVHKSWLQLISFKTWQSLQGWSMFCSPGFLLHPVCVFMYKGVFFMRTLKRCLHTCNPCFGAREGHYTMHCIIVIIIVIYSDKTKLFNFSYLYTLQQRYYILNFVLQWQGEIVVLCFIFISIEIWPNIIRLKEK